MRTMARRIDVVERATEPVASVEAILASPCWWALQQALVRALRPHPEAASAVLEQLRELGAAEELEAAWRRRPRRR
jgi:hypothetical protein